MREKRRKQFLTVLKITVSAGLLYVIFTKIEVEAVAESLRKSNLFYMGLGLLFFVFSKIVAAFRLQGYFHQIGANISSMNNLRLYLLGMFYNLFLPGGIGGDAYKGYLIQKQYQPGTKKVVSVLLLDRLSGMVLLFSYTCLLAVVSEHSFFRPYSCFFILALPLGFLGFWVVHTRFFPYVKSIFWKSVIYSSGVQLLQLLCVLCLLESLSVTANTVAYLLVFLVSSIVSVIPLTIGGIGSREFTFLYGAQELGLDADLAITLSVSFFVLTALISLTGVIYHVKKYRMETV